MSVVQQETVGQRLQRLRERAGMTQRALARDAATRMPPGRKRGLTYSYVCRIESGDRRPSVRVIRALAGALGVTAHYLEFGHEYRCRRCGEAVDFNPLTGDALS